jgi:hypothetical protein
MPVFRWGWPFCCRTFLPIQTPFVRVTFGFLPIAIYGAMYGPWKGRARGSIG